MKIFFLIIIFLIASVLGHAQSGPIKVGEFRDLVDGFSDLPKRIELFTELLLKEPDSTRGAITFLNGSIFDGSCLEGKIIEDRALEKALNKGIPKNLRKRIQFIPGTFWTRAVASFYLVPDGAKMPAKPEPNNFDSICCCSDIKVEGTAEVRQDAGKIRFTLILPVESKKTPSNPVWTVSAGKIIRGQGSKAIEVDIRGVDVTEIVAEVTITSANPRCNCPITASYKTQILTK